MTAKERILELAPAWSEQQAERALHAAESEQSEPEFDVVGLPESWKTFADGTPQPNWVAAINRSRRAH